MDSELTAQVQIRDMEEHNEDATKCDGAAIQALQTAESGVQLVKADPNPSANSIGTNIPVQVNGACAAIAESTKNDQDDVVSLEKAKQQQSVKEAAEEPEPEPAKPAKSAEEGTSGEPEPEMSKNILYVAKFLLPDKDGDLKLDSEQAFLDKPTVAIKDRGLPNTISSVLEEHRELSCKDSGSSLPLREQVDHLGLPVLHVLSPILLNALKAVITFQSGPDRLERGECGATDIESSLESGRFVYPFRDLYHSQQRLLQYREKVNESHDDDYSETCRQHLDILLEYLTDQAATILKNVPRMLSHAIPKITLRSLWFLFKPGSDVYVREDDGKLNAYVIESSRYEDGFSWNSDASPGEYCVYVWYLNFDGRYLTRSVKEIIIPVFDGQREIRSLPVFPVEFHHDETLRQQLIDRGKRFVEMIKRPALREYSGPSKLNGIREFNQARVVIDHVSEPWDLDSVQGRSSGGVYTPVSSVRGVELDEYIRIPKCPCQACDDKEAQQQGLQSRMFEDYDRIDLQQRTSLTDHQYLLCPSHVYGVILKDNIWDVLEVERLEQPRIQANLMEMLIMKTEENKQMIKAICETYGGSGSGMQTFSSDLVRGKGEGRILLLHGPPGTGKTLTAEAVAEYKAQPLLSITAAELGRKPQEVENNLLAFFRTAKRWNAIVLLDNADDLLETRAAEDSDSQAAVGFLRALDYFQGILFLTSNRVRRFDKAIMSRIHVQIGYDPVDEGSRQKIWDNHFRNHETQGHEIRVSSDAKEFVRTSPDLQALKWNGHEIRNAFQTALALACSQAKHKGNRVPELTDEHLRQVVNMSQNFRNYLDTENESIEYIYV